MAKPPKFFLDKFEQTISTRTASRKLENNAVSELEKLFRKGGHKLLYVTKVIDPGGSQYRKSTPLDALYEAMDKYIKGESFEGRKDRAAERFIQVAGLDMEELKLTALVKDAAFYKLIVNKADGHLYHHDTQTMLGKNPNDVIEYLKNPVNEEILGAIVDVIETEWNK